MISMTKNGDDFDSVTIYVKKEVLDFARKQIRTSRWRNVSHAFEYAMAHMMVDHPKNISNGD